MSAAIEHEMRAMTAGVATLYGLSATVDYRREFVPLMKDMRELLQQYVKPEPENTTPERILAAVSEQGPGRKGELLAEAAAGLAHAEVVEFRGGDHDLHAQYPERVADLIGGLA